MDKTKQRIKIAEACGWKILWVEFAEPKYWSVSNGIEERKLAHYKTKEVAFILGVPDYLNDLNAMREAEKMLAAWQRNSPYLRHLASFPEGDGAMAYVMPQVAVAVTATAEQRAEAFLRTLGLWEEPK